MKFAEECKAVADSVLAARNNYSMIKAIEFYDSIKPKIKERADAGLYKYIVTLNDDISDCLTKLLEEDGFEVSTKNIHDCGHFIQANVIVCW